MAAYLDWWLSELLLVVAALGVVCYVYMRQIFTYWKDRNIKYLEPSFPFGNALDIILQKKSFSEAIWDWHNKLDGLKVGGAFQVHTPVLVLRDPEIIKDITIKEFMHFADHGFFLNEEADPLSANLFMINGERWKNLRVKLTPLFTSGKMKALFRTFEDCGHQLREYLSERAISEETLDMKEVMGCFATDIIASCVFGIESNALKNPNAEFREKGRRSLEPTFIDNVRLFTGLFFPTLGRWLGFGFNAPTVAEFFSRVVQETVAHRRSTGERRRDFMQLLIELQDDLQQQGKGSSFTMNDLAAQALVFFLGGSETTSSGMGFCLYELALNPDIQERLRSEIRAVVDEGGMTYDVVQGMGLLDRVVSETLRKYPPAGAMDRVCSKDYHIPELNYTVEKGTRVFISLLGLHRDPEIYPDPEKFDPDRFLTKQRVYFPFGEGPRQCIGNRFALLQMKVGLAMLLSEFKFTPSDKTPYPMKFNNRGLVLASKTGIWLKVSVASPPTS